MGAHTLQVLEVFGALVFDGHRLEVLPLKEVLILPIFADGKDAREVAGVVEDLPALVTLLLEALLEALVVLHLTEDRGGEPVDALTDVATRGLAPVLEVDRAVQLDVGDVAIEEAHILLVLQRALLAHNRVDLPLNFGAGGDLVAKVGGDFSIRPLALLPCDPVARPIRLQLAVGLVQSGEVRLDDLSAGVLRSGGTELVTHRLVERRQRSDLIVVILDLTGVALHPEELLCMVRCTAQRLSDQLGAFTLPDSVADGIGARGIKDHHHDEATVIDRLRAPLLVSSRVLVVKFYRPAVVHPVAHSAGGLRPLDSCLHLQAVVGATLAPCVDE